MNLGARFLALAGAGPVSADDRFVRSKRAT
jgi:hypothetical protein